MIVHKNWHCSKCFQIISCMVDSSLVCPSLNFYVYLIVPVKASLNFLHLCTAANLNKAHGKIAHETSCFWWARIIMLSCRATNVHFAWRSLQPGIAVLAQECSNVHLFDLQSHKAHEQLNHFDVFAVAKKIEISWLFLWLVLQACRKLKRYVNRQQAYNVWDWKLFTCY